MRGIKKRSPRPRRRPGDTEDIPLLEPSLRQLAAKAKVIYDDEETAPFERQPLPGPKRRRKR